MIRTAANFRSLYHITHNTTGPNMKYTMVRHPSASYTTTLTTTTTQLPQIQLQHLVLSSKSLLTTKSSSTTRFIVFQRHFVTSPTKATSPSPPSPPPQIISVSSVSDSKQNMIGQIIQRSKPPPLPPPPPLPTMKTGIQETTTTKMTLKNKAIPKLKTTKVAHTNISSSSSSSSSSHTNSLQIVRVGLPLILFSVLSAWVVSNAYGGKLKELEVSQGKSSISIRQAALELEHDEMMERLNKIVNSDYDNTKRIQRPEEVLEQRRLERQRRNVWYRRWYRAVTGQQE